MKKIQRKVDSYFFFLYFYLNLIENYYKNLKRSEIFRFILAFKSRLLDSKFNKKKNHFVNRS